MSLSHRLLKMINQQAYEAYKRNFLTVFPDGENFQHPTYLEKERNYKLELSDVFLKELAERINTLPDENVDRLQLANEALNLFQRKLQKSDNKPQNLVGFRYWNFLTHLSDEHKVEFIAQLNILLHGGDEVCARVDVFLSFLETVPRHPDWNYSSSWASYLLVLSVSIRPIHAHVYPHIYDADCVERIDR